jgi:transposase
MIALLSALDATFAPRGPQEGIMDTSKHFFQLHGVDYAERPVLRRKLRRNQMLAFLPSCRPTVVGMGATHYWARELSKLGHEVKLMAPQHVKAYIKRNKNDGRSRDCVRP